MISGNDSELRRNLSRMLFLYAVDMAAIQHAQHVKRGRKARTFRYAPTAFHARAVRALGYGDSETVAAYIHTDDLSPYLGVSR